MALNNNSRGQALLIVVVTMAVIVTIAISVVSRSVTDITVTNKEEEALRSFTAAEAGIEQTLLNPSITTGTFGDASFVTTTSSIAQESRTYSHPDELLSGETATFWFIAHDDSNELLCDADHPCFTGNTIKICWGDDGTSAQTATTPAIEVSVVYDPNADGNYADVSVIRGTYDPHISRSPANSFTTASGFCSIEGKSYAFSQTIDLQTLGIPSSSYDSDGGLLYAKVRSLYNTTVEHPVAIDITGDTGVLPSQGTTVESVGQSGDSNRKVQVFTLFPEPPAIFDSAVYSSGSIQQ